ncbi:uroporphyrinogen-III C-methyltransferase [Niveispirillum lacus]|uniref:Uroporphyrinogen-III C-methyltransferase n=1 Tax=Niveispirillum lacus TaxID=1981099 RepID=A0A255YYG2_9PROT|nr:siroheme synthase CysG [Niveispirillum lacus]OYQ34219.1 uroporphyrinogen-III C-methyltransferase [Niveispirillum lacus]
MLHLSSRPDPASPMPSFPIFLDLRGRPVLVAGGGDAAASKARLLARAGADILLLAATVGEEMLDLLESGVIQRRETEFRPELLDGVVIAIDGSGDPDLTDRIRCAAFTRNVLVNVVDVPEQCDFTVPAILDRSPVVVAVSTSGGAPALSRNIRQRLEAAIPAGYASLARAAQRARASVRQSLSIPRDRQRFWDRVLSGDLADRLMAMDEDRAVEEIVASLSRFIAGGRDEGGSVTLVGAGPGDPGLLTVSAARAIGSADIILHDALVPDSILALARRETRLVSVGKRAGCRSVPQEFTNRLMATCARKGLRVVRLKGGDPFIFGRAGEEAEFLRGHGVAVTVIPGITAAMGAAAQLGLPLTHRGVARSMRVVTAHCRTSGETDAIDWTKLADPGTTLALYMGRDRLGDIADSLIKAGLPPDTPAALIANACRPDAEVRFAPIAALPGAPALTNPAAPSLILVGDAVALAPGWAMDKMVQVSAA